MLMRSVISSSPTHSSVVLVYFCSKSGTKVIISDTRRMRGIRYKMENKQYPALRGLQPTEIQACKQLMMLHTRALTKMSGVLALCAPVSIPQNSLGRRCVRRVWIDPAWFTQNVKQMAVSVVSGVALVFLRRLWPR